MAQRFLQIAVVYLFLGACLGLGMGMAGSFTLVPVHAHVLLLGWVSLALAGLIYHLHPRAGATRLAKAHFWVHNIALPVFMLGLALMLLGNQAFLPVVVAGGTAVLVGLALFALNVLRNVRAA